MTSSSARLALPRSLSPAKFDTMMIQPITITPLLEKRPPLFESLPPEIRIKIYRYLLSADICRVKRHSRFRMWWKSQAQLTYEFDTAILQTNRLLSREAHAILYSDNLLVLLEFNTDNHALVAHTKLPKDIAFNSIPKGISLPSKAVHITHQQHPRFSSGGTTFLILAANDFPAVCNFIADCALTHMTKDIYTITTLPPGYRAHNRLSELIWDPLKVLRGIRSTRTERQVIKAVDSTGFFENTDEMSDWELEGEEEYFSDHWYDDETTDAPSDNEVDTDSE